MVSIDIHLIENDSFSFRDARVSEVLLTKAHKDVHFVMDTDYVIKAIRVMSESKIGAVLVKNNENHIVGIFTERDYLNKVVLKGHSSPSTRMSEVMTDHLYCVGDNTSVLKCMHLMTNYRFRHLPVINTDKQLLGMVSIGDLVKTVITQYKETVSFLRDFIEHSY